MTKHKKIILTHCPQGHEFTKVSTYTYPSGRTRCRICQSECDKTNNLRKKNLKTNKTDCVIPI